MYNGCTKLRLVSLGHKILVVFEPILMGFVSFGYARTLGGAIIFRSRRIVAIYRLGTLGSVCSLLWAVRIEKTTLSCFFSLTFNYAGVLFSLILLDVVLWCSHLAFNCVGVFCFYILA